MRVPVTLAMLLASQIATADIAARVAAGKSAVSSRAAQEYYVGVVGSTMPPVMKTCAPPGSSTATEDWKLTVVGNVSARGQINDIEIEPHNAITTCVAEQLKKITLPAPPASLIGAKGFPLQVEAIVTIRAKAAAGAPVAVTRVFSQLVAFSYPAGFAPAFENGNPTGYLQESVLKGETTEKWSQMITLTGAKGAASIPDLSPTTAVGRIAAGIRNACPSTFASKPLGTLKISGYDAFIALAGCGAVQTGPPRSEVMLLLAIKARSDVYTIQWAERSAPIEQAPVLDNAKWAPRFQQLGLIRVCDPVPGEAAPYPSCISPPAGK